VVRLDVLIARDLQFLAHYRKQAPNEPLLQSRYSIFVNIGDQNREGERREDKQVCDDVHRKRDKDDPNDSEHSCFPIAPPNSLELRAAPRACEGQLPGGSSSAWHFLAHSGRPVTIQPFARQPGQLLRVACPSASARTRTTTHQYCLSQHSLRRQAAGLRFLLP